METMIERTAKQILDIPKGKLSVSNVSEIIGNDYVKIKAKLKAKIMLLLLDCHNKKLSITDAIVIINNWENGTDI